MKNWKLAALAAFLAVGILSCTTAPTKSPVLEPGRCQVVDETRSLVGREMKMPAKGYFVLESHLATTEDDFPAGRLFPKDSTEGMDGHLARSCGLLGGVDCAQVYSTKWHRVWTPPEGGKAGQGSVGDRKPTPEQEMFSGNMFWAFGTKPQPGELWLVKANGKAVVIAMGFETGPRSPDFLGGLQGEVLHALGATSKTEIELGRLVDQGMNLGPVNCGGGT